jgi:hypothetical protein
MISGRVRRVEVCRARLDHQGGTLAEHYHLCCWDAWGQLVRVSGALDRDVADRVSAGDLHWLPWLSGGELDWARQQAWICVRTMRLQEERR